MSDSRLAPYAVTELNSRGRVYEVEPAQDRTPFQRDVARLEHSRAWRRLHGKTQVFSATDTSQERTRMSHSIEVKQYARAVARQLRLNEDLCEALAIGHDLGHPPFGHMGQDILNQLMAEHGGFEHNYQVLRLVDKLDSPYIEHRGLNLTFEVREGLLKHCSYERALTLGDVARRHVDGTSPPLEVQVVDCCDSIAYLHGDLEDAFNRRIVPLELLKTAPGFMDAWGRLLDNPRYSYLTFPSEADLSPQAHVERQRQATACVYATLREMASYATSDLIQQSRSNIQCAQVRSLDDVRRARPLIQFSDDYLKQHQALRAFSRRHIYENPHIAVVRAEQARALTALFHAYVRDPREMSGRGPAPDEDLYRSVTDHIAGMTDGYAMNEHARLLAHRPELLIVPSVPTSADDPPRLRGRRP